MHQLQGQTRCQVWGGLLRPRTQQIPSAQAEMFGNEQPQSDQITTDFIGQQLPDTPFQTGGIRGFGLNPCRGPLGLGQQRQRLRSQEEFFFVSRNPE